MPSPLLGDALIFNAYFGDRDDYDYNRPRSKNAST